MTGLRTIFPLVAIVLTSVTASPPFPTSCDIENGFDYPGRDIGNKQGPLSSCCNECIYHVNNCAAWTWTNYNNGTCWFKDGVDKIVVNADAKSSRILSRYCFDKCYYYADVDFAGNDIGSVKAPKFQDCCGICQTWFGCRAYSWNNYNGGTCWLKSKRGDDIVYKPGVVSAEAYMSGFTFIHTHYAIEKGVDYVGNDIKSVSSVPISSCSEQCNNQYFPACTAFSWNNYQGGTCWLKSGRGETKVNRDVISAVGVKAQYPQ